MKRLIISILAATAFCIHADAQRYTLGKCLEIGLENNYALRIIRNKEQIAHNNATAANAGYLPTLDLSAGYDASLSGNNAKVRSTGEVVSNPDFLATWNVVENGNCKET